MLHRCAKNIFASSTRQKFPAPTLLRMTDGESEMTIRRLKIYTRTGDKGTSSLFTGERRDKDDAIFEAMGTVDELTSMLGLAREYALEASHDQVCGQLERVQSRLQDINSNIATPRQSERSSEHKLQRTMFDPDGADTKQLEQWIDEMDEHLPELKQFILPSGGKCASTVHVARTICRRAERRVHALARDHVADRECGIYLNRLSDYLFTAGRFAAMREGKPEV
eukprot:Partr_v1_DN24572_c0_g1_i1_m19885 putative methylmalonic aciduria (cobalamin deficiency) cblB type